jgi:hypothetical protein
MRRTELALALMLVLFSVMFSVQVVKVAKATSPVSSEISIISPTNTTYSSSLLTLRVSMIALVARNSNVSMAYSLDGRDNVTIPIEIRGREMSFQAAISGSLPLSELSVGPHSVTVYSEYILYNFTAMGVYHPKYVVWGHNTVYFTVDDGVSPVISNLSFENKTYNENNLSLSFTTDEPTSWISYCLDQQANATITGNATLTGLADGSHRIVVYANDTAGNMGASETIFFTILQETPSESFPTTLVIAPIASVIVVGMGLLVYFRKRRK